MTADEWADEIAQKLPPLTPAEIDAAGCLAAALDAKRVEARQPRTERRRMRVR